MLKGANERRLWQIMLEIMTIMNTKYKTVPKNAKHFISQLSLHFDDNIMIPSHLSNNMP